MFKKILSVMILLAVVFICGQNNFAQAKDVYMGNDENGNKVYLMTESIDKKQTSYSKIWKMWSYECYVQFKSVHPEYGPLFFGYTITWGPEEEPGYKDKNGNWQGVDESGEVNPRFNSDPDVYRARILNRAYKYLCDNGYV